MRLVAVVISREVEVGDGILDACYLEEQGKVSEKQDTGPLFPFSPAILRLTFRLLQFTQLTTTIVEVS